MPPSKPIYFLQAGAHPAHPPKPTQALLAEGFNDIANKVNQAKADMSAIKGLHEQNFLCNPADPAEWERFAETVRSGPVGANGVGAKWDGIGIGFGVRGAPEYTAFFNYAVNFVKEQCPGTKLVFNGGLHDVAAAIVRAFPQLEE